MKNILIIAVLLITGSVSAQYKESAFPNDNIKDGIVNSNSTSLFGFLNSESFQMHHSYSLSYSAVGNSGLALGVYTNSMFYKFADNLNVQADVSFVHSPYSTFGKSFQDNLTGLYLTKAAVNYKPWQDFSISIQYRNLPMSYYSPYGYYGYRNSLFNEDYNDPFFR